MVSVAMFSDCAYPIVLAPNELDKRLAAGWFRMGGHVFTTQFIHFGEHMHSVVWLRANLPQFVPTTKQRDLLKKNSRFSMRVEPLAISHEHERLYRHYVNHVDFSLSPNIQAMLLGYEDYSPFQTFQLVISDNDRPIAIGYFDIGETSVAGISCIYDPAYKKFGLGNYLMLCKMLWSQHHGFRYFYPGYVVPNYPKFDYKWALATDALQFYDWYRREWQNNLYYPDYQLPIDTLTNYLEAAREALAAEGISSELLIYQPHDFNTYERFRKYRLLDYPVILLLPPNAQSVAQSHQVVVYNLREACYELLNCKITHHLTHVEEKEGKYTQNLLKPVSTTFAANTLPAFVEKVGRMVKIANSIQNI